MAEIARLADRVTVLRDGAFVGTLSRSEIDTDRIVRMMVGRDLASFYKRQEARGGRAVRRRRCSRSSEIGDGKRVHGCSFALAAGEILGIAGLVGSGRTEMARLIFGADPSTGGHIRLDGTGDSPSARPRDAIGHGIVYLTEDRKGLGLFLDMSVRDNINTMVARRATRGPAACVNVAKAERARARRAIERALDPGAAARAASSASLSGGNQQKVLLSRLLQPKPRVVILDEPTRGVDIGAKSEIYRIIDELARERHRDRLHLVRAARGDRHRRSRAGHARAAVSSA